MGCGCVFLLRRWMDSFGFPSGSARQYHHNTLMIWRW